MPPVASSQDQHSPATSGKAGQASGRSGNATGTGTGTGTATDSGSSVVVVDQTAPPAEPTLDAPAEPVAEERPRARKGRAKVPSWDEIVFGARPE